MKDLNLQTVVKFDMEPVVKHWLAVLLCLYVKQLLKFLAEFIGNHYSGL